MKLSFFQNILRLTALFVFLNTAAAQAQTITNVACDTAALVAAVTAANGTPTADTLNLEAGCIYTFTSADSLDPTNGNSALPAITTTMTINGNGATLQRASEAPDFRLLRVAAAGSLTLENIGIAGGRAAFGGGIRSAGIVTVRGVSFTGNFASSNGGAIYHQTNTLTVIDSVVSGNTSTSSGGGINNAGGTLIMIGSTVSSNQAVGSGGLENTGILTVVNSTISGNNYTGISNSINGQAVLINNTVSGNLGTGIYNSGSTAVTVIGNTIAGNGSVGIHNAGGPMTVANSIIWGNQGKISGTSAITVSYSTVQGSYIGTSILSSDPLFVQPVSYTLAPTTVGNYHLQFTSPVIDKGSNAALPADTFDLDGDGNTAEPLPYDRDGDARTINGLADIGSDEETTCLSYTSPYTVAMGDTTDLAIALTCANTNPDASVVNLTAGVYNFTGAGDFDATVGYSALPSIYSAVTINGGGAILQRDPSAPMFRLLRVKGPGHLKLNTVTISGGALPLAAGAAEGGGGGIHIQTGATLTLTNSLISGNSAGRGGGIYIRDRGHLILTNSTVSGNTSIESGGGIYSDGGPATLTGTVISGNNAGSAGGGVFNMLTTMTITGSSITGNSAADGGGGIVNNLLGNLIVTDSTVSGNSTLDNGGGISNRSSAQIIDSSVSDNTAWGAGGGIINFGTLTVVGSTISGNSADTYNGGGIASSSGTLMVVNTTISGNSAKSGGGVSGSMMTFINTAITGNAATNSAGGGISSSSGTLTVTSSTVAGNNASGLGGGIYSSSNLTMTNSIVWGNSSQVDATGLTIKVTYSTVEGGYSGIGNLGSDPLFAAPIPYADAPAAAGDYRLQLNSPATEAGSNEALPLDTLDLDNDSTTTEPLSVDHDRITRVINGTVDQGAYEGNNCPLYVSPYTVPEGDSLRLRVAMYCANANPDASIINLTTSVYTFTSATVFHTYSGDSALPRVRTPITINGNGATITRAADSPNFRLFQLEFDGTLILDNVTVTGGRAPFGGGIYNNGTLTVRNSTFSGNSATSKGGAIANYGVMFLETSSVVDNTAVAGGGLNNDDQMTVTNSHISGNEATFGGGIETYNGTLRLVNSTVSENSASSYGGGISNLNLGTMWITNSVVSGNSAGDLGGGIYRASYNGTLRVTNSIISGNSATTGGGLYNSYTAPTITNSTIAGNSASTGGGIYNTYSALTVKNSIVWGNSSGIVNTASSASLIVGNSVVQGGFAGTENINADPLFVNPISHTLVPTADGDYRLQAASPALNVGSNSALPVDTFDLDGDGNITEQIPYDLDGSPRIVNIVVDMGANEHQTVADVVVSETTAAVIEGSDTDTYSVRLASRPSAIVTVDLSTGGQLTVDPYPLTFMPSNWSVAQTVTVTAVDDGIIEGAHEDSIAHSAASTDATYSGIPIASVTVTITDNDAIGVIVEPTVSVTEGIGSDTYSVVLTRQPTASVTITPTGDAQCTVSGTLTITSADWNTPQEITVTAFDDAIAEGAHTCAITNVVTSDDPDYNDVSVASVTGNVTDNDTADVSVELTVAVTEGGATDTYTVVLMSQPTASVTITPTGDADCSISGTLTFTDTDWNTAQIVTVTAVNDAITEGSHACIVTNVATSSDANYGGISVGSVSGSVTDNDTAGVMVEPTVAVTEGGATDTYTVVLTSQPTASVTITPTGDADCSISGTLTFTYTDWNTAQIVTVTAVNDAITEGSHACIVTNVATSSDANYGGISVGSVSGSVTDNDTAGVTVEPTVTLTEGGEIDNYPVVLTSQPLFDVTITPAGDADCSVSAPLTFTSANWQTPQPVTITAVDDAIAEGAHSCTITHMASSGDPSYNSIFVSSVTGSITDNDSVGVAINPATITATEGGVVGSYTIALTSQPTANVIVTPSGDAQCTASAQLTFTDADWQTPQPVTITAVDDTIAEGEHSCIVTHTTSSADQNYSNIFIVNVSGNITDDDAFPAELLDNGSFEADLDLNRIPDGWTLKNRTGDKVLCQPGKPNTGSCTFRLKGGPSERAQLTQTVNLSGVTFADGDTLTLSAFFKGNNPAAKVKFVLSVTYTGNPIPVTSIVTVRRNKLYTQIMLPALHIGAESVASIKVRIKHLSGGGSMFVDDASLIHTALR